MAGIGKPPLDLKQFMLRAEVLRMYRQILRTARKIPNADNRSNVISWARKEIEENKNLTDVDNIKSRLKYASVLLNELRMSLQLSQT